MFYFKISRFIIKYSERAGTNDKKQNVKNKIYIGFLLHNKLFKGEIYRFRLNQSSIYTFRADSLDKDIPAR